MSDPKIMSYTPEALFFALCLLIAMVAFLEIGRRMGLRRLAVDAEGMREGAGAVEASGSLYHR